MVENVVGSHPGARFTRYTDEAGEHGGVDFDRRNDLGGLSTGTLQPMRLSECAWRELLPAARSAVSELSAVAATEGRLAMDPIIEVNVDDEGMVTVTIVDSDGKRGKLEMPLDIADILKAKLESRLNAFHNRRGWR
jgi:hypothetical protein